jgi:geranylgeranyl diphosphate synthase, type II
MGANGFCGGFPLQLIFMVQTLSASLAPLVQRLGPPIDAALREYTSLPPGCPEPLREAMRYSLLAPGKRMRPMLALLSAEACGGPLAAAMPAACAVEMVHAYSLIHDDLPAMDDDDLRRGRPTCHKAYGEAMAILAGDGLLSLAFQVLADHIRPLSVAGACCAALAEAAGPCQLVGGQADDMLADVSAGKELADSRLPAPRSPLQHLESIHARKTGAMIRVSLRLGAMAVAASAEQLTALDEFGRRLGLAFQVTDDLLDVCGSDEGMGKRVGKDAQQGKITFPALLGVEESAAYAACLIEEARAALSPFGEGAEGLLTLARYVLERDH